ncbi:DUF4262 domain-containing protein [Chitinophaga sp. sic0106]|nr:DUF4262 domain-containing protein [Chitinophaga sp. sic0106]
MEEDAYLPGFAYTIGLFQKYDHPEIICFGLPSEVSGSLLNDACEQISSGQIFTAHSHYSEFLKDFAIQFLPVHKSSYADYLGTGSNYYHHTDFPVLQLVWPDKQSLFPWESEFNPHWKFRQPLLDRNFDFKFYEERNVAVFTTSQVLEGQPIRFVYHNEDGAWQFHSDQEPSLADAKLVSLEEIVRMDPTVNVLFQLLPGEAAWRNEVGEEWAWE